MLFRRITFLTTIIIVCLSMLGCANNENMSESIAWSVSNHSDATGRDYEEVQGYKAAFYKVDEITTDATMKWIDSCDLTGDYYQHINSDPASWEMYIYYPSKPDTIYNELKFYIDNSCVNVYVESSKITESENNQDYLLVLIQASMRGAWPSSSKLFIDGNEIQLKTIDPHPNMSHLNNDKFATPDNSVASPSGDYLLVISEGFNDNVYDNHFSVFRSDDDETPVFTSKKNYRTRDKLYFLWDDSDNIWVYSGDIGTTLWLYEDGKWSEQLTTSIKPPDILQNALDK